MIKEQQDLIHIQTAETEILNSSRLIIEEMVSDYKKSLIGKKVRCWDYTFKHWYDSDIVKVDVQTSSTSGLLNGMAYVVVTVDKGKVTERLAYHNIEHVKFLED